MKKTMTELWRKEGILLRESPHYHKEIKRLTGELCACEEKLRPSLTDEHVAVLEHMQDIHAELATVELEEAFAKGLTLGIRITVEAFEE